MDEFNIKPPIKIDLESTSPLLAAKIASALIEHGSGLHVILPGGALVNINLMPGSAGLNDGRVRLSVNPPGYHFCVEPIKKDPESRWQITDTRGKSIGSDLLKFLPPEVGDRLYCSLEHVLSTVLTRLMLNLLTWN